jgi:hypothetical protein
MAGNNLSSFTSLCSQDKIKKIHTSEIYKLSAWNDQLSNYKHFIKDTIIPIKFKDVEVLNFERSGQQISHRHYYKHEILDSLKQDAVKLIFNEPIILIKGFVFGLGCYFWAQGDYVAHVRNSQKLGWYNYFFHQILMLQYYPIQKDESIATIQLIESPDRENTFEQIFKSINYKRISWTIVLLYLFIFLIFFYLILFKIKNIPQGIFIGLIFFLYLFIAYSIFGLYENNRLRYELISLEFLLSAYSINIIFRLK